MSQLEVSVCWSGEAFTKILERFKPTCQARVTPMAEAWVELLKMAFYKSGPSVSEVGTTWVSNLVGMNALRPFTSKEIADLGTSAAFLPPLWQTAQVPDRTEIWAIPWLADVRVIYYWRDLLEQAGIDEKTAFQTAEQFEATLQQLQAKTAVIPWGVPLSPYIRLHNLASWVWGAGGDFVSPDGKRTSFCQPQARAGIHAYFNLNRYMNPEAQKMSDDQILAAFIGRRLGMLMSGQWVLSEVRRATNPEIISRLGIALPPGPPYFGGTSLIIWNHAPNTDESLRLISFLTSPEISTEWSQASQQLPVRLTALAEPPFSTDEHYPRLVEALKHGRPMPRILRWGLIEEKLVAALHQIWLATLHQSPLDLPATLTQYLEPLSQRLDAILAT